MIGHKKDSDGFSTWRRYRCLLCGKEISYNMRGRHVETKHPGQEGVYREVK